MLRRIAAIVGYVLATGLVVVLTIGLVAYGQDYSYDFTHHKIVRSGNVIIQTVPSGVKFAISGKTTSKKSSYRLDAGKNYLFGITRAGYHAWEKSLAVVAGKVTLVQYVVLVPNNPATTSQVTAASVASDSVSRDHHHVAYLTTGSTAGLYSYDVGSGKTVKLYTPAAATDTTPAETLTSVAWSDDASRLLVMSKIGDVVTARIMSAAGTNVINLTTTYNYDFSGLQFNTGSSTQLYWMSPDGLRRLDLDNQTVSAILAANVKQFQIAEGNVFYVQASTLGESLWVLNGKGNKPQIVITALPASDNYGIAYTNYRGTDALAVVPSGTQIGTLYTNIFSDVPVAQTIAHGVTAASFSPDGHLLEFHGATTMTTYDLDQSSVFGNPVQYTFTVGTLGAVPSWFDNFHLLLNENGRLVWREYDGQNAVDLGAAQANLAPFVSSDIRSIYSWTDTVDESQLMNTLIKQ